MLKKMKWFFPCVTVALTLVFVCMKAVVILCPKPELLTNIQYSRAVFDENHHLLRLTLSKDAKFRLRTPLSEISPEMIEATLLQEDQYFNWHYGLNPISILKAAWQTVFGERRFGASTITMQLARIRYKINSKRWPGKLLQIVRAMQLEAYYSKKEILEAYLNLAPYGNNVEGVGAASFIYFNKSPKDLTLPELLTLAVIPQNPSRRAKDADLLKRMRDKLFVRWLAQHPEDKNKTQLMKLPLSMHHLRQAPFIAPHFVNDVLNATPLSLDHIVTTLNLSMQKLVERIVTHYLARKAYVGVNNAAVLIVDSRDMGVKAIVGSGDFFNRTIEGQVNGTTARRSPGSTLKPFIYALAIDQGLIHEATLLKDVPHRFGAYNPENFDNDFVGPIKARDALILSRNIPAVFLADQLTQPTFYEFLQQANITQLKSEAYYGLALALGGAEVSMQELVELYAMLANDGAWHPLRLTSDSTFTPGKHLISAEASFLILDMLQQTGRHNYGSKPHSPVSWKTGTSSGYRDAWTVGVFGPYVMAVWIGNFNNQSNPVFIGKEIAAPLFFEIMTAIDAQFNFPKRSVSPTQMNLKRVAVCKTSGMLPTRYCTATESIWFIPGKSPIKTDTIHREVPIDIKTGLRACHFDDHTRFEIYEFWSSDLLQIFKRAGIGRKVPPPYEPSCTMGYKLDGFTPQIISPQLQVDYVSRIGSAATIPFIAVVDADVRSLYWFLNETFLGKTARDQSFLWSAKPGKYVVRVVDDYGRSDARDVKVRLEG